MERWLTEPPFHGSAAISDEKEEAPYLTTLSIQITHDSERLLLHHLPNLTRERHTHKANLGCRGGSVSHIQGRFLLRAGS